MKDTFTTGQVAKICKVSSRTVNKWVDAGKLRGYRNEGSSIRLVLRANLLQFLQEHNMPLGELEEDVAPARRRAAQHRQRAYALAQRREYTQAIQELDEALVHYVDGRTLRFRGTIYYRLGSYDKALDDLNAALHRPWGHRGWYDQAIYLRARIFYQRGEYDRALSDLDAVIRSQPQAESAYRLRARIHRLLAKRDQATAEQLAGLRVPRPRAGSEVGEEKG